jgi:uncharacterized repeat protein (TIGR01451 family)
MSNLCRYLFTLLAMLVLVTLTSASVFRTVQQTREPPLGGRPVQPVPVVPGPPYYQQPAPVPPVPRQPFPSNPLQVPPGPMPAFPAMPPLCEVPCPPVDPPTPLVKIQVRVPACAAAGQEIKYTITVENCSPAPAHHVLVRNPLPANARFCRAVPEPAGMDPDLIWLFGTLPPGACKEICLVLIATDACELKNCARVQFEHGQCVVTRIANAPPGAFEFPPGDRPKFPPPEVIKEPPQVEPKEPPKVIVPRDTSLSVKITGPKKQYANLPAKYQITVTNSGAKAAENVLISAILPDKSVLLGASDNGRFHFGVVNWLAGDLPAGASRTVQVTYKVPAAGEFCLKANASGLSQGSAEATWCTTFEGVSALHLEATDARDPIEVGGKSSYRITLLNQGTAPLTNIRIEARVPPEMATYRATGPTNPPKDLPPPTAEGQLVVFAPLRELKAGEKLTYEIFVTAVKPGDARFRVTLTADELQVGGPVIEEESTQVFRDDDPFRPMKRRK